MGFREIEVTPNQKLTVHELEDVYDSVTGHAFTGSWLWNSALFLSRWLASSHPHHIDLQGKKVLELGAGVGLPGLAAARLGASRVVLTDIAPLLPVLLRNVEVNGLGDRVEVKELSWGSDESLSRIGGSGEFDVVLMSDVFFDQEEVAKLGRTLKGLCGKGTRVVAGCEVRCWTGECLNELASQGFGVVELASEVHRWEGDDGCVFAVYQLVPPNEESCHVEDMLA
ncbi:hypothetical protein Tsubulata_004627 [Turnera subulata]|uniref:Uncharacterized protein n=1 Tax=Turnera subulata TaxID=218843 RepID=A0A9Q0GD35_9ROSI|nr:hypothetical protein Tsubulata_004627 [Turnera subulata]